MKTIVNIRPDVPRCLLHPGGRRRPKVPQLRGGNRPKVPQLAGGNRPKSHSLRLQYIGLRQQRRLPSLPPRINGGLGLLPHRPPPRGRPPPLRGGPNLSPAQLLHVSWNLEFTEWQNDIIPCILGNEPENAHNYTVNLLSTQPALLHPTLPALAGIKTPVRQGVSYAAAAPVLTMDGGLVEGCRQLHTPSLGL